MDDAVVTHGALVEQLTRLVDVRLIDPLEILLDPEPGAAAGGMADAIRDLVRARAARWASDLLGPDDTRAFHLAARLVMALYPGDGPFAPPAEWWQTPLGRVYLRRVGYPGADAVPYPVAGAMLGVSRQFVHDLVSRGKLARHPDGGVRVESIVARLAERGGTSHGRGLNGTQRQGRRRDPDEDDNFTVGGPPAIPEP